MPYSNPKQPVAIFLDIKRRQGLEAAKAFGRKHSAEMSKGSKAAAKNRGARPYRARKGRSS